MKGYLILTLTAFMGSNVAAQDNFTDYFEPYVEVAYDVTEHCSHSFTAGNRTYWYDEGSLRVKVEQGCSGLIRYLRKSDVPVYVYFVTDGSASHPNSLEFPPQKLAKVRKAEALRACKVLGISSERVEFMQQPDSKLDGLEPNHLKELVKHLTTKLEELGIQTLALPWHRDPHSDHQVVYTMGEQALKRTKKSILKIEYPIWLWKNGQLIDRPKNDEVLPFRLSLDDTVLKEKKTAINNYKSQLGTLIFDDPEGFVLTEDLLKPFQSMDEYYLVSKRQKETLSKRYFDALYQENSDPWNFTESTYEKEKYNEGISALGKQEFVNALEIGCSIGIQTRMLAGRCLDLLAVDISRKALRKAKEYCAGLQNVRFEHINIARIFPDETFDLITLCEVGYYFEENQLLDLFRKIDNALITGGKLLLVHWTPFVPDYPLTGNEVHNLFENTHHQNNYDLMVDNVKDLYKLQVWQKSR